MKKCSRCGIEKEYSDFFKDSHLKSGYRADCKECHLLTQKKWKNNNKEKINQWRKEYSNTPLIRDKINKRSLNWNKNNPEKILLSSAKKRAKAKGLEFSISLEDIYIPDICPILGIPIKRSEKKLSHNSPTIDRIDSSSGYIKGNIQVISHRANTLKSNASLEEITKIYNWFKENIN